MNRRRARRWCCLTLVASCVAPFAFAESLQQDAQLGPVQLQVELSPEKPRMGDILSLTIRVVSEPDVEVLMPEFGEAMSQFQIVDFAPQESLDSQGRVVHTQKYSLQPSGSGPQRIPPIMVEFVDHRAGQKPAPPGEDAYELSTARIDFPVESVLKETDGATLLPPRGELQPWPTGLVTKTTLGGGVLAIMGLMVAAIVAWWLARRHRHLPTVNPYELALARLNRLIQQPIPQGEQMGPFFVELSALVREYLENRFELRAPELTTEEFLEQASAGSRLVPEHQGLLRDFLRHADLVKFAGWHPDEQVIRQALQAAERFLRETRDLPLTLSDPASPSKLDGPLPSQVTHA